MAGLERHLPQRDYQAKIIFQRVLSAESGRCTAGEATPVGCHGTGELVARLTLKQCIGALLYKGHAVVHILYNAIPSTAKAGHWKAL